MGDGKRVIRSLELDQHPARISETRVESAVLEIAHQCEQASRHASVGKTGSHDPVTGID
jgi:hypothetical protein